MGNLPIRKATLVSQKVRAASPTAPGIHRFKRTPTVGMRNRRSPLILLKRRKTP